MIAARRFRSSIAGARHAGGFSLLEVLVAFIIVALVVTALFRLYGGALGNASAADGVAPRALSKPTSDVRSPRPHSRCVREPMPAVMQTGASTGARRSSLMYRPMLTRMSSAHPKQ